jgi:hypothetical protein
MITQGRFSSEPAGDDVAADGDPVGRLRRQVDELGAYILQQWAVRADRALLGLRRLAVMAIVGATALVALSAWIVTAVVSLLQGAAGGLASVLDGRIWLASLIVGSSAIAMVGLAAAVMLAVWTAASKRRTRMKYERRQSEQRRRFGHSAHDRAL